MTESTSSRITRLLRPLKCKSIALSSYFKLNPSPTLTQGSPDQELLPLDQPNIGIRIHLSKAQLQALQPSKKLYAVRDSYYDIILRAHSSRSDSELENPTLPSLTTLCSVILGSQISCTEDEGSSEIDHDDATDPIEDYYQAIPTAYRFRTLFMHALHIILDSCPPHIGLCITLLDVTLRQRLYYESEVLVDIILDRAFELTDGDLPRICHPTHRKFLVELDRKWCTQFSRAAFARLLAGALQRAPSDLVWTSKATRRLVRDFGHEDINLLSPLLVGLVDFMTSCRRRSQDRPMNTSHLQSQLREWFSFGFDVCTLSLQGAQIAIQNGPWLEDLLNHFRCRIAQARSADVFECGFTDTIACLYTLSLLSDPRPPHNSDIFRDLLQHMVPSPSTYTPICLQILQTRPLDECESMLHIISSMLRHHQLYHLNASLWACSLDYIEDPGVQQILITRSSQEDIGVFRLRLIDNVEDAERSCFHGKPKVVAGRSGHEDPLACKSDDVAPNKWDWEPAIGCWFRRQDNAEDSHQLTSKRRRFDRDPGPSATFRQSAPLGLISPSGSSHKLLRSRARDTRCNGEIGVVNRPVLQFTSLLSNALSNRTILHGDRVKEQRCQDDDHVGFFTVGNATALDDCLDGDEDDLYDRDLDCGQHAPSEDSLDLFRITGTSSPAK